MSSPADVQQLLLLPQNRSLNSSEPGRWSPGVPLHTCPQFVSDNGIHGAFNPRSAWPESGHIPLPAPDFQMLRQLFTFSTMLSLSPALPGGQRHRGDGRNAMRELRWEVKGFFPDNTRCMSSTTAELLGGIIAHDLPRHDVSDDAFLHVYVVHHGLVVVQNR